MEQPMQQCSHCPVPELKLQVAHDGPHSGQSELVQQLPTQKIAQARSAAAGLRAPLPRALWGPPHTCRSSRSRETDTNRSAAIS
jgi:hypothetical protein